MVNFFLLAFVNRRKTEEVEKHTLLLFSAVAVCAHASTLFTCTRIFKKNDDARSRKSLRVECADAELRCCSHLLAGMHGN